MTNFCPTPALIEQATTTVVKAQCVSVSLLQRELRTGYELTLNLIAALQSAGVTTTGADGRDELTPNYREGDEAFKLASLEKFSGCDGGDPGVASSSVWIWGVEHGAPIIAPEETGDEDYGIDETQRWFPFNRNVFKLLTAVQGQSARDWLEFARLHQPFVRGAKGYFKGNLYPYPCHTLTAWTEQAQRETGFATKERYLQWCRSCRLPLVANWVKEYRPNLVIACGTMHRNEFLGVFFDWHPVKLETLEFIVDGKSKRIYFAIHDGRLLAVVPHLSGARILNSFTALQAAGAQIAALWEKAADSQASASAINGRA
jgi:hypothetical protein